MLRVLKWSSDGRITFCVLHKFSSANCVYSIIVSYFELLFSNNELIVWLISCTSAISRQLSEGCGWSLCLVIIMYEDFDMIIAGEMLHNIL